MNRLTYFRRKIVTEEETLNTWRDEYIDESLPKTSVEDISFDMDEITIVKRVAECGIRTNTHIFFQP